MIFKLTNMVMTMSNKPVNVFEEQEPFVISIIKKLLKSGAIVQYVSPDGTARSFNHIRRITGPSGEIKKFMFINYPQGLGFNSTVAGEKILGNLNRLKVKKQSLKALDGRDVWHLFDAAHIKEEMVNEMFNDGGEFFVKTAAKLAEAGKLWYVDENGKEAKIVSAEKKEDKLGLALRDGKKLFYLHMKMLPSLGKPLASAKIIKMSLLDEFYTIKKDESSGQKRFLLVKKDLIRADDLKESKHVEMPFLVSMLMKLVRAHFNQGTAKVVLRDNEYGIRDKFIRGAAWRFGNLEVSYDDDNHLGQIIYPIEIIENGIKLWKNKEEDYWVLEYL